MASTAKCSAYMDEEHAVSTVTLDASKLLSRPTLKERRYEPRAAKIERVIHPIIQNTGAATRRRIRERKINDVHLIQMMIRIEVPNEDSSAGLRKVLQRLGCAFKSLVNYLEHLALIRVHGPDFDVLQAEEAVVEKPRIFRE
jgi:hypothetical protein